MPRETPSMFSSVATLVCIVFSFESKIKLIMVVLFNFEYIAPGYEDSVE